MTDEIVKVVVPSYGLRGLFNQEEITLDEFEKLKGDYIEECNKTIRQIDTTGETFEGVVAIFEKLMPPFQYWLENKIACKKINAENSKTAPNPEAEKKAREFTTKIGTKPADL